MTSLRTYLNLCHRHYLLVHSGWDLDQSTLFLRLQVASFDYRYQIHYPHSYPILTWWYNYLWWSIHTTVHACVWMHLFAICKSIRESDSTHLHFLTALLHGSGDGILHNERACRCWPGIRGSVWRQVADWAAGWRTRGFDPQILSRFTPCAVLTQGKKSITDFIADNRVVAVAWIST